MKVLRALAGPFMALYKNRRLVFQTTKNDIKSRYAGSLLGLFWTVLYPILFLGCYALIYILVLRANSADFTPVEYVIFIFCGLVPFLGFSESFTGTTSSVVSNINLMKNTLFPIELVPVKTVFASSTTQAVGFVLILIVLPFIGRLTVYTPLFLVLWLFQLMLHIGLGWFMSALNVVFRDLQNVVGILVMLLMMLSPIAIPPGTATGLTATLLKINPLYYVIVPYQEIFMYGRLPDLFTVSVFMFMSLFLFICGYHFFMRMKKVFTDNV